MFKVPNNFTLEYHLYIESNKNNLIDKNVLIFGKIEKEEDDILYLKINKTNSESKLQIKNFNKELSNLQHVIILGKLEKDTIVNNIEFIDLSNDFDLEITEEFLNLLYKNNFFKKLENI